MLTNSDSEEVALACLASIKSTENTPSGEKLRETFHNTTLQDIRRDYGEHVIVTDINVVSDMTKEPFEGVHLGSDDAPTTLDELYRTGFYLWPLQQVVLLGD